MSRGRFGPARPTGAEVIVWRCSKGCALLRVYLSAQGWVVVRSWHAPQRPAAGMAARFATETRPGPARTPLPLDVAAWGTWPPTRDTLSLACRHGGHRDVDLALLAEDADTVRATRQPHTRTLPR